LGRELWVGHGETRQLRNTMLTTINGMQLSPAGRMALLNTMLELREPTRAHADALAAIGRMQLSETNRFMLANQALIGRELTPDKFPKKAELLAGIDALNLPEAEAMRLKLLALRRDFDDVAAVRSAAAGA
jgi:hypothetical protein